MQHPLQALVQGSPLAGAVQLHQLLTGHVQQLVQVHVTVGETEEALLLLHFQYLARCSENSTSPTPVQLSFKTLLSKVLFVVCFLAQIWEALLFRWPYFQF